MLLTLTVAASLAGVSLLSLLAWTCLDPRAQFWPAPGTWSWQSLLFWALFRTLNLSALALAFLDWQPGLMHAPERWFGGAVAAGCFVLYGLACYTLGCHSLRHLVGGKLNCFSCGGCAKVRYGAWQKVTHLNEHQDGSDLDYNGVAECEGLGEIGSNQTGAKSRGLHLHSTLAVATNGLPLGVLHAQCLAPESKSPDEDRPSYAIPIEENRLGLCKTL